MPVQGRRTDDLSAIAGASHQLLDGDDLAADEHLERLPTRPRKPPRVRSWPRAPKPQAKRPAPAAAPRTSAPSSPPDPRSG